MNVLFEIPDVIIVGVIAVILLVIIITALFIKAHSRKVKPIDEDERYDSGFEEDVFEELEKSNVIKENITDEQREAKAELERVYKRMSEDLEKQNNDKDEIDDFEREQEENAIISYQELVKQADKLKKEADEYEQIAENKADMEVEDAIKTFKKHDFKESKKSKTSKYSDKKKFKSSDIVSPIYGIQSNKNMVKQKNSTNSKKSDIISKAYNEKEFEMEKTQNIEFLNSLKEFRKNL